MTQIRMDWNNLNFKAKDVLIFGAYIITAVLFLGNIRSSIERQGDKINILTDEVTELKSDGKTGNKEYQVMFQNLQNQVNLNSTQIMMVKQDVDQLKKK